MNKVDSYIGSPAIKASAFISSASSITRSALSLSSKIFKTPTSKATTALGLISMFRTVSGAIAVAKGLEEIKTAQKTDDVARRVLGQLNVAQGGIGAVGGLISIPGQLSSIFSLTTPLPSVISLGKHCGMIGRKLLIVGSVLGSIAQGIRLHEHRVFREQFYAILNDLSLDENTKYTQALAYLKTFVSVSFEEKEEIRRELSKDLAFVQLSLEEQMEKITAKEQHLIENKKALLRRVLDQEHVNLINRANASNARETVEAVKKKSFSQVVRASIKMGIGVVGLALSIASFIFTGGITGLIIAGAGFLLSARSLIVNTMELVDGFKNGSPGRFDKLWLVAWTVMGIATTSIILAFSPPLIVMVGVLLLGTLWLGVSAAAYYRTHQLLLNKV